MSEPHSTPTVSGRRTPIALFAILALGVLLRFYAIGAKTVWLDEAFSIWIARHNLLELWNWLVRIDHHPPLYYSLLHGWQSLLGDTQGIVRSLSALCSALALPFFYAATRRFFDRTIALIATLVLAISPFHVRFAQEARMYALLTLGAAVTLYFVARLLLEPSGARESSGKFETSRKGKISDWSWLGLGIAQAAVMLTHNTATLLFPLALNLPVLGALYIARRTGRPSSWPALNQAGFLRRWLLSQGVALLLWLPWSVPFVIQVRVVDNEFWLWAPSVRMVLETLHNFNFAFIPGWFPALPLWDLLYWLLAAMGVWSVRRRPARAGLLLSLFLTPMIGELLVSLRRPIFYDRTLIWTTLPYYMLLAAGIGQLGRRFLTLRIPTRLAFAAQLSALVLVVALSSVSLWAYYVHFHKEQWDKAAAYVAARVEPGQLVLFNASWVQIPFEYYFRHYETGAQLRGLPNDLFASGELEPKMTPNDVSYLSDLVAERNRVWLVYSHDWYTDPDQVIPQALSKAMQETDRQQFVGLQVIHYARETPQ